MNIIIRLGKVMTMRVYECSNFLSSPGHQSIDHLLMLKCPAYVKNLSQPLQTTMKVRWHYYNALQHNRIRNILY